MLPGMGTDERIFGPQRAAGLEFETPALPDPYPSDTIATYARRIRDQLRLDGPCVVGGVSFGGMIAYELARITQARRVVLVASCTSSRAIPWHFRPVELICRIIPDFIISQRAVISGWLLTHLEGLTPEQLQLIREMARDTGVTALRRIGRMILTWDAPANCPCPVHHIHGARDSLIPLRKVNPEVVVPNSGHLINMTHPNEVNAFLARYLSC